MIIALLVTFAGTVLTVIGICGGMVEVGSRNIDVINAAERAVKQARHRPESNLDFSPGKSSDCRGLAGRSGKIRIAIDRRRP